MPSIPQQIIQMRKSKTVNTELFIYTRIEYRFARTLDHEGIRKLIGTQSFKNIDWSVHYTGKNREMYDTIGEFFVMVCVKKIFESFTKKDICGWINILCILMKRGYLSHEIIKRVETYISQKRMPRMLRCMIRILTKKYLGVLRKEIKSVISTEYYRGIDGLISTYVL